MQKFFPLVTALVSTEEYRAVNTVLRIGLVILCRQKGAPGILAEHELSRCIFKKAKGFSKTFLASVHKPKK